MRGTSCATPTATGSSPATAGAHGIGKVHRILTRRTFTGEHAFDRRAKTKALSPDSEVVIVPVPPIANRATLVAAPVLPARCVSGPMLLTGLIRSARCGGAMTISAGKGGRYRPRACPTKARQGPAPADARRCR